MNNKITTNSQLSTIEPKTKTKTKTKQPTRTGTESQKWRSQKNTCQQGELVERMGEKLQEIKSITGRYKIDRGKLRIV